MKHLFLLSFAVFALISIQAQEIPIDERVTIGQLDNGMHYYIMKNEKPKDRAEFRLALKAGSIMEDDDQQGLAHFVEHMAFNGTENFEKNELIDYLELTGTRFGPDLNAYTSFDETVYMLQVRTDSAAIYEKGLQIMRDWAGGVTFEGEEIDKERGVIMSEYRSRLSPDQRMSNEYFPVIYKDSKYANRLPIGKTDIIENAPYERLRAFYRDWYRPNLMALIVVGDIDVAETEKKIKMMFAGLQNPSNERERTQYEVPLHKETRIKVVDDEEAAFTRVQLGIKHPEFKVKDEQTYRTSLTHRLYNNMLNDRLRELSQSENPPYLFAYSGYGGDVGNIDAYNAVATTDQGKALTGLNALMQEIERVQQHGFLESELDRAKTELLESAKRSVKEADKRNSGRLAMRYVYHFLDDNPIPGPKQMLDWYEKLLPGINLDEVNALPKQWLTEENRTIIVTGPKSEEQPLPSKEEIQNEIMKVKAMDIEPYEEASLDEPLVATLPPKGFIESEKTYEDSDVEEWTLSNGIKVVLKQTDFQNDEIMFRAESPGGHSLYSDDEYFSVNQSASVVAQMGFGAYSSTDLQKKLAGKNVSVSPYVGTYSEGMRGSSSVKDLETLFQLIHLGFVAPRKDEALFNSWKQRSQGIYSNLMQNPQYYFIDYGMKVIYDDHPRMGFPDTEDFEAVNLDDLYAQYNQRFSDANDFTFFFVGNFDRSELKNYAMTYLANLPVKESRESWRDFGLRPLEKGLKDRIERGKAEKTYVRMNLSQPAEHSWKKAFIFDAMTSVLSIKLRENLREDKGGVYGVRAGGGWQKDPYGSYTLNISFNSEPEQADLLIDAVYEEINTLIENGPEDIDVEKVRETKKQQMTKEFKENSFWMGELTEVYEYDLDPEKITLDNYLSKLDWITSENIHQMAKECLLLDRMVEIVMSPEAAAEE